MEGCGREIVRQKRCRYACTGDLEKVAARQVRPAREMLVGSRVLLNEFIEFFLFVHGSPPGLVIEHEIYFVKEGPEQVLRRLTMIGISTQVSRCGLELGGAGIPREHGQVKLVD